MASHPAIEAGKKRKQQEQRVSLQPELAEAIQHLADMTAAAGKMWLNATEDQLKTLGLMQGCMLRQAAALEKIARHMGTLEDILLRAIDGNDGAIKVKDIDREKVLSKFAQREGT